MTVTFYCKPYVAQYLKMMYGRNGEIALPRRSSIRFTVFSCFTKEMHATNEYNRKQNTARVDLRINKNDASFHGQFISPERAAYLNSTLEEKIKIEALVIISKEIASGSTKTKAIQDYQQAMGFDEETFSWDAIRVAYDRMLQPAKTIFHRTVLNQKFKR